MAMAMCRFSSSGERPRSPSRAGTALPAWSQMRRKGASLCGFSMPTGSGSPAVRTARSPESEREVAVAIVPSSIGLRVKPAKLLDRLAGRHLRLAALVHEIGFGERGPEPAARRFIRLQRVECRSQARRQLADSAIRALLGGQVARIALRDRGRGQL